MVEPTLLKNMLVKLDSISPGTNYLQITFQGDIYHMKKKIVPSKEFLTSYPKKHEQPLQFKESFIQSFRILGSIWLRHVFFIFFLVLNYRRFYLEFDLDLRRQRGKSIHFGRGEPPLLAGAQSTRGLGTLT